MGRRFKVLLWSGGGQKFQGVVVEGVQMVGKWVQGVVLVQGVCRRFKLLL